MNTSNFDPIPLIQEDLNKFVNIPIPKDFPLFIQCRLKRDKDGVQGGFFPTFYLHAERFTDKKKVITNKSYVNIFLIYLFIVLSISCT
jgi:hypothetical protein